VAFLAAPGLAQAQNASTINWVMVLSSSDNPSIQIVPCPGVGSDPRDPAATVCVQTTGANAGPTSGYAETDNVTYGDIVGDGGTEAVVPIDSGGSIGELGSLVYTLDSTNTAHLATADGPGGDVFINASANELVSISFEDSCSSMNCPAGLIRTGY